MKTLLFLCLLLTPSWCTAVEVQGPSNAAVGDLVILSIDTDAQSVAWFLGNSDKTFLEVERGRRVVFSSGTSGEFKFCVAAFSASGKVEKAEFAVRIGLDPDNPQPGPAPDPDTPTPPAPTPDVVPDFKGFPLAIYTHAMETVPASPERAQEAKDLAEVFEVIASMAAALSDYPRERFVSDTSQRVRALMEGRPGFRERWATWKSKMERSLSDLQPQNKADLVQAWNDVARALKAVR